MGKKSIRDPAQTKDPTYRNGNFADNLLGHRFVQPLEQPLKAGGHQLHKDPHLRLHNVIPIALDNVGKVQTLAQQFEIVDDVLVVVLIAAASHFLFLK